MTMMMMRIESSLGRLRQYQYDDDTSIQSDIDDHYDDEDDDDDDDDDDENRKLIREVETIPI